MNSLDDETANVIPFPARDALSIRRDPATAPTDTADPDAVRIGRLYREASPIFALQRAHELGQLLQTKKKELGHRHFGPWLDKNKEVLGFEERTARRYMRLAKRTPPSEVTEVEAARLLREMWKPPAYQKRWNANDELYSPPVLIADARKVLGSIELDVASCAEAQKTVQALRYFDKETDALKQEWSGRGLWMNPPFSIRLIGLFVEKLLAGVESRDITEAIAVTVNSTETEWGQALLRKADAICFWKRCIEFFRPSGVQLREGGLWGHAVWYFGPHPERFREVFGRHGVCVIPEKRR